MNGASTAAAAPTTTDAFASAMEKAVEMTRYLESRKALDATHSELEGFVATEGARARDVLADLRPLRDVERDWKRPRPTNKRVWAGISKSAEDVIRDAFDEARRRDPDNERRWVVLLDGNRDQLRYVKKAARKVGAPRGRSRVSHR